AAYYDGNPQSVTIRDAAIAFAIASGITQPSQIVSFVNNVLRVQPPITLAEVTTANPNPVAISDFDGDGRGGTIRDAAILFAIATLRTRDANRINDFVNNVLRLQPPLNLTPEQAARLPGPGFVPPTGPPPASPSPSPPGGIPTLGVPQSVTGRLTTSSPRDPRRPDHFIQDFLLSASVGQTVRIQLSSSEFDTYLFIVNQATGQVIAENDDFGGSRNSQLDLVVQAGINYLVRVSSYAPGATGAFQLRTALVGSAPTPSPTASPTPSPTASPTPSPTASPTTSPPPPAGGFNIEVEFIDNSLSPSQRDIVLQAARRWEQIITGDLPDVAVTLQAGFCPGGFPPTALVNRRVDDILVQVTGARLLSYPSAPGEVVGQGGPCGSPRPGSGTFPYGMVGLDPADLARVEADGRLFHVVLHELGHVLGFGTIRNWDSLLRNSGTNNPRFAGPQATAQYNSLGGLGNVPVELERPPEGHWRRTLGLELMTPVLAPPPLRPALSRITAAAMQDLGFTGINLAAADPYELPPEGRRLPPTGEWLFLGDDAIFGPIGGETRLLP
ncbi:peptidase M8, partial [Synechococcus sp. H60.2]|uniref:peptidase M8 n=1 Tax=Synechococcus sp. H60.2 TaxID=2964518 RepID=UPI0039C04D77